MFIHICSNVYELRAELTRMRRMVYELAQRDSLLIVAASTHPFAHCTEQDIMDGDRYRRLLDDFRAIARRGTSAQKQKCVFEDALQNGASDTEALHAVVDHPAQETVTCIR